MSGASREVHYLWRRLFPFVSIENTPGDEGREFCCRIREQVSETGRKTKNIDSKSSSAETAERYEWSEVKIPCLSFFCIWLEFREMSVLEVSALFQAQSSALGQGGCHGKSPRSLFIVWSLDGHCG